MLAEKRQKKIHSLSESTALDSDNKRINLTQFDFSMASEIFKEQTVDKLTLIENQTITNWTQLWFRKKLKCGYVQVVQFVEGRVVFQRSYGNNQVNTLINDMLTKEDVFISINAFEHNTRTNETLKQIRNIMIDCDTYKIKGMTNDLALSILKNMIEKGEIPEPNAILISHGIQLLYTIYNGCSPNIAFVTEHITSQFISKLKHIGADTNAGGVAGLMRLPGTYNTRNNSVVQAELCCSQPYTLDILLSYCEPIKPLKKSVKGNVRHFIQRTDNSRETNLYKTLSERLNDLETLIELRNGDFTHKRNTFIYIYAYHRSIINNLQENVEELMRSIFVRLDSRDRKMTDREFKRTVKSAYDDAREFFNYLQQNGYQMFYKQNDGIKKPHKTDTIIKVLEITEEEQDKLYRLKNSSKRAEIKREKDRINKEKKRRDDGRPTRDEYDKTRKEETNELNNRVIEMYLQGIKQVEIANAVGKTKGRVSQIIKAYKGAK